MFSPEDNRMLAPAWFVFVMSMVVFSAPDPLAAGTIRLAAPRSTNATCGSCSRFVGQELPRKVVYTPTCHACKIERTKLVSLGSPRDPVLAGGGPVRDTRGRYLLPSVDRKQIVVFDSSGRYLTAFGREGDGPGELARSGILHIVVGTGDTIFAFQNGRMTVFDPAFRPVRGVVIPPGSIIRAEALPNGTFVLSAMYRTASTFALPFHILDANGRVLKSFGNPADNMFAPYPSARPSSPPPPDFVLAADRRTLWIAPAFRLRQWTVDGHLGKAFDVVNTPWFPAMRDTTIATDTRGAVRVPLISGLVDVIHVDKMGIAWIYASRSGSARPQEPISINSIDAFDTASGNLLMSMPMEPVFRTLATSDDRLRGSLVYSVASNDDGVRSFTVWRLNLVRP